ncbi:MAG: twin-arginine translocase TatA/TatE family subunit [Nitrospirota bacterium]|jgi:sec-independent protein translocase protein TatA
MFGLGMQELVIVSLILVVLFGATKLPELGRGVGLGIKNFKKAIDFGETPEKPAGEKKG